MLELLDYRRRVTDLYQAVRDSEGDADTWRWFVNQREWLFKSHPQSALDAEQKSQFRGLSYFDYNPDFRVIAEVDTDVEPETFRVELAEDGVFVYHRFARVDFVVPTGAGALNLYWVAGYGGGLFLPFGDLSNHHETYGGGRYLFDTMKGADLGTDGRTIILDFNYAYNPSCAYNSRWSCPLVSSDNRLPFAIPAGEKQFT